MSKAYLDTVRRLEPDITTIDVAAAAASVSISVKRVADVAEELRELLLSILEIHAEEEEAPELAALVKRIRKS